MEYKIIAYISGGKWPETLDLSVVTHVNYAFGLVDEENILIRDPEQLFKLREETKKAGVKLLVSLNQARGGAWFCQRSKTEEGRKILAKQSRELLDKYDLDGIDVDWEYPGIFHGEKNCDTCLHDFVELIKEMRLVMGDKLLTYATPAMPDLWEFIDFPAVTPYFDYINLMSYDFNWSVLGAAHQSNLFPGTVGEGNHEQCTDRAFKLMLDMGIPACKLNLGVPFYGYVAGKGPGGFLTHDQIHELLESSDGEVKAAFDEGACQSYLVKNGQFYCCYDDPRTIACKADYVKKKGMGGMMYWTYNQDSRYGILREAVKKELDK